MTEVWSTKEQNRENITETKAQTQKAVLGSNLNEDVGFKDEDDDDDNKKILSK
jgi:hypothetical protein